MCAVHVGENTNELTLSELEDKIFDSSDYNVFRSISFVLQISGKDLSITVPEKIPLDMFLNEGMLRLLIVKYKITSVFCLSFWIVKNLSPERPFMGIEIFSRYNLLCFHEFRVSAFLDLIKQFKIHDATVAKTSLITATSSLSIFFVIISVFVIFKS